MDTFMHLIEVAWLITLTALWFTSERNKPQHGQGGSGVRVNFGGQKDPPPTRMEIDFQPINEGSICASILEAAKFVDTTGHVRRKVAFRSYMENHPESDGEAVRRRIKESIIGD